VEESCGACSTYGREKKSVNCWLENLEKRKHLKFIGGRIILKLILKKQGGKMYLGFIRVRIGTSSELLLTW
jgi:hypothetical protein